MVTLATNSTRSSGKPTLKIAQENFPLFITFGTQDSHMSIQMIRSTSTAQIKSRDCICPRELSLLLVTTLMTFPEVVLTPVRVCVLLKEPHLWAQSLNKATGCSTDRCTSLSQTACHKSHRYLRV